MADLAHGEFRVNTYTDGYQRVPVVANLAVANLADGGFAVTWHASGQDGDGTGIYAQRYDESGTPVGNEIQVNPHTDNFQSDPSVAALFDGGFLVTWESRDQDEIGAGLAFVRPINGCS